MSFIKPLLAFFAAAFLGAAAVACDGGGDSGDSGDSGNACNACDAE